MTTLRPPPQSPRERGEGCSRRTPRAIRGGCGTALVGATSQYVGPESGKKGKIWKVFGRFRSASEWIGIHRLRVWGENWRRAVGMWSGDWGLGEARMEDGGLARGPRQGATECGVRNSECGIEGGAEIENCALTLTLSKRARGCGAR